jgi:hypothetical protein
MRSPDDRYLILLAPRSSVKPKGPTNLAGFVAASAVQGIEEEQDNSSEKKQMQAAAEKSSFHYASAPGGQQKHKESPDQRESLSMKQKI